MGRPSRVLTYTGVQLGGGGGLVGPGAAPSAAPGLAPLNGTGIESGVHAYAVTFVTASGESLPGPLAAITVGATAAPASAPIPGAVQAGGAVDAGTHTYAVTFVTPSGETTSSPASAPVTTFVGSDRRVTTCRPSLMGPPISMVGSYTRRDRRRASTTIGCEFVTATGDDDGGSLCGIG